MVESTESGKDIPTALGLALDLLHSDPHLEKSHTSTETSVAALAHEIRHDVSPAVVEQKFAALDLIAHVIPKNRMRENAHASLVDLLGSPVWLIRQRAAEVLALLTPPEGVLGEFNKIFHSIQTDWRQNSLHGSLLYCRELLQKHFATSAKANVELGLPQLGQQLSLALQSFTTAFCAPPVVAILLEIMNDATEQSLKSKVPICESPIASKKIYTAISKLQGFYLVQRSFLYNISLSLLIPINQDLNKSTLLSTLHDCLQDNPDVARYLLERLLLQRLAFRPQHLLQLDNLFSPQNPAEVSSLAMHMISLSVEQYPLNWDATAVQQILTLIAPLAQTSEVRASRMLAQAMIFSLSQSHIVDDIQRTRYLHAWEHEVQNAARDEMDTHVRFQAAKAISAYLPRLLVAASVSNPVGLLLTLRDLLNDDEEDVRSSAAQTASSILCKHGDPSPTGPLAEGICAPAAAIQLEDYLRSVVTGQPAQHEVLLRRLLDAGPDIDLEFFLREHSVLKQLTEIDDESSMLFAVERQNLYVDEVHDIHFWCSMCTANKLDQGVRPAESVKAALGEWVADGLEEVRTLLEDEKNDDDMLPNATFDLDALLICVRVVCVAGAYLSLARSETEPSSTYGTVLTRLRGLMEIAGQVHLNAEIACSLDYNLEVIVRR